MPFGWFGGHSLGPATSVLNVLQTRSFYFTGAIKAGPTRWFTGLCFPPFIDT